MAARPLAVAICRASATVVASIPSFRGSSESELSSMSESLPNRSAAAPAALARPDATAARPAARRAARFDLLLRSVRASWSESESSSTAVSAASSSLPSLKLANAVSPFLGAAAASSSDEGASSTPSNAECWNHMSALVVAFLVPSCMRSLASPAPGRLLRAAGAAPSAVTPEPSVSLILVAACRSPRCTIDGSSATFFSFRFRRAMSTSTPS